MAKQIAGVAANDLPQLPLILIGFEATIVLDNLEDKAAPMLESMIADLKPSAAL